MLKIDSKILFDDEPIMIIDWINEGKKKTDFRLLYRGSRDGFESR